MPTYDYLCLECGKKFTAHATIAEHERHKAKCPKCGRRKLQHRVEEFLAITTKKS
jgi:putative FmdB family regulatory protein